jgi:(E)-4-hydroxy-3-methylbut-2-enyl-diphosphate synthase
MWCAPSYVNLKKGTQSLGHYTYDEILGRLRTELDRLIEEKKAS